MGVREILACGVAGHRTEELEALGFAVKNLDIIRPDDDYATVTHRLSCAWKEQRRGFLLGDPVLDVLISGECAFDDLPEVMPTVLGDGADVLCHAVRYDASSD